jgi:uncharacterized protein YjiK
MQGSAYLGDVMRVFFLAFAATIYCAVGAAHAQVLTPLNLVDALPIEGPENIEPSGLTIVNNTLFTISDEHDDTIFRIELRDESAVLFPHITFPVPESSSERGMDFEGITSDADGNFYLLSESNFRILRVSANGDEISWITPSLRPYGDAIGLFQARNTYLESIAFVGGSQFIAGAERQPRGLLEINLNVTPPDVQAFRVDVTKAPVPQGRAIDFSGMFYENGTLYTLHRSAEVVNQLTFDGANFEEEDLWSFSDIVNSEDLRYSDREFGMAEGVSLDSEHVYVILDNNGIHRDGNPEDNRPWLLIMERPH